MTAASDIRVPGRLRRLPRELVCGVAVPVAERRLTRLFGLAHLDREQAGPGLLIPRCSSVHTFGMRFPLDLLFLDRDRMPIRGEPAVGPRRLLVCRRADAVLELPAGTSCRGLSWERRIARGRPAARRG